MPADLKSATACYGYDTAHGSYTSIGDAKHTFIPSHALLPLYKLILIILRVR